VTTRSPLATLDAANSAEYTLVSRQGNRIELDMKAGITASGSSPGGVSATADADVTGRFVIDLDKLVHTMTMQSGSVVQPPTAPGQPAGSAMRTQMRMTLTPEPN
jgi:hypothetical protein